LTATWAAAGAGAEDDDGGPAAAREARDAQSLARIVFALLVLACIAAFFVTQRLKHTPTVVQRFEMSPSFTPSSGGEAHLSFKLAHADEVTVEIVDATGDTVATLVRDYPVARYKQFSLRWNGRRGTARGYRLLTSADGHVFVLPRTRGAIAPAGEYHVLVSLRRQGRKVRSPRDFTLSAR
jgi:hypothetical protein